VGPRLQPRAAEQVDHRARSKTATHFELTHGDVVIAAITSCTNTSNPSVMVGAGLLAKKAGERGLNVKPWVKTSLAPGSRVVTELPGQGRPDPTWRRSASTPWATAAPPASATPARCPNRSKRPSTKATWWRAAVLSGNRNFEGRVSPDVRANFLASPPLVVAYASPARWTSTSRQRPRSASDPTAARLPEGHLAHAGRDRPKCASTRKRRWTTTGTAASYRWFCGTSSRAKCAKSGLG
jgi:aconitase A